MAWCTLNQRSGSVGGDKSDIFKKKKVLDQLAVSLQKNLSDQHPTFPYTIHLLYWFGYFITYMYYADVC